MKQYEYYNFKGRFPRTQRNFVRENITNLREMQKLVQKSQEIKPAKFKGVAPKMNSFINPKKKLDIQYPKNRKNKPNLEKKIIHTGVQTERPEDIPKLYETGVLKYPSPSIIAQFSKFHETKDQGDHNLSRSMMKLDLDDKQNYIKQNIKNIKANRQKREGSPDHTHPPPTYQKGVLPKYLLHEKKLDKQDVKIGEFEGENVAGLVLLPDDERKEYLRVARENYASLIKELNSMPISNDTLKKRRRKMDIEDELRRLDEVIKIFQRPKVFVKADA